MVPQIVVGGRDQLENLKRAIEKLNGLDASRGAEVLGDISVQHLLAHLVQLSIVRSAGLVEITRDSLAEEYCRTHGNAQVAARVKSGLYKGQGVRSFQLYDFLRSFDTEWARSFDQWLDGISPDGVLSRKEMLNSIVGRRVKLAHGQGQSASPGTAMNYCSLSLEASRQLESIMR